jgi:serine phosphatase RsbU (regulator of sigma subunit)/pSer/pThr/pTyr-binding forkhead associated (FHA) protein
MARIPRFVVIEPGGSRREVDITPTPFRIGRQAGNELALRDSRISRQQAQIIADNGKFVLEDMGSRHGTFVNGQRVIRHELHSNDKVEFGVPDSFALVYLSGEESLGDLLQRVESSAPAATSVGHGLHHLGVLLEVARALHSSMSLEDVLASVLDAALQVTKTQRGVLLLKQDGELVPSVARDHENRTLTAQDLEISQSVLRQVVTSRRELIVSDTGVDDRIRDQASVVRLELHTIVAIPLEKLPVMGSLDTTISGKPAELLGVLYLDSHAPSTAFSDLDREVLRSLAQEAATVVENARLFALARARERLDHEMKIAQEIQRRLLPKAFPESAVFSITGSTIACELVGGDYFDVLELEGGRHGLVVADIAGKGIPAALMASMLQGTFSATAGVEFDMKVLAGRVNKYMVEHSLDDRYATLFYGVLHPDGALEYLNAGHVPGMVLTAGRVVRALASENFPLGMFDFAEYHSKTDRLQPGDFLVLYSDGFSEAQNERGDLYGETNLRGLLERFSGQSVDEMFEWILSGVREYTGGAPQSDDMTLVILHYRGTPA